MPLPYPGQDAVPFTTLTAQFYDETIANIESLADGSGLDSNAVGIIRLNSMETTDVQNGSALVASTWTDTFANKSFTVDNSTSVIRISCAGSMQILAASNTFGSSRLVIDSAGTPQNIKYGGGPITSTHGCNPLTGGSPISVTGLASGSHTVKLQVLCGISGNQYLRALTQPNQEFLTTTVVEMKK